MLSNRTFYCTIIVLLTLVFTHTITLAAPVLLTSTTKAHVSSTGLRHPSSAPSDLAPWLKAVYQRDDAVQPGTEDETPRVLPTLSLNSTDPFTGATEEANVCKAGPHSRDVGSHMGDKDLPLTLGRDGAAAGYIARHRPTPEQIGPEMGDKDFPTFMRRGDTGSGEAEGRRPQPWDIGPQMADKDPLILMPRIEASDAEPAQLKPIPEQIGLEMGVKDPTGWNKRGKATPDDDMGPRTSIQNFGPGGSDDKPPGMMRRVEAESQTNETQAHKPGPSNHGPTAVVNGTDAAPEIFRRYIGTPWTLLDRSGEEDDESLAVWVESC